MLLLWKWLLDRIPTKGRNLSILFDHLLHKWDSKKIIIYFFFKLNDLAILIFGKEGAKPQNYMYFLCIRLFIFVIVFLLFIYLFGTGFLSSKTLRWLHYSASLNICSKDIRIVSDANRFNRYYAPALQTFSRVLIKRTLTWWNQFRHCVHKFPTNPFYTRKGVGYRCV